MLTILVAASWSGDKCHCDSTDNESWSGHGGHVHVGKGQILVLLWAEWQSWGHSWKWHRLSGSSDISAQAEPLTVPPKDRPECPQQTNKNLAFHNPGQPAGQLRAAAEMELKSQACRRIELTYWNHSHTATPCHVDKKRQVGVTHEIINGRTVDWFVTEKKAVGSWDEGSMRVKRKESDVLSL